MLPINFYMAVAAYLLLLQQMANLDMFDFRKIKIYS
jgi:hypothetical protein